jgi:hypothetical protein
MKYNDVEKWEDLKGFYSYKENNPMSTQNDYHCVKELKLSGVKGSIHISAKEINASRLTLLTNISMRTEIIMLQRMKPNNL